MNSIVYVVALIFHLTSGEVMEAVDTRGPWPTEEACEARVAEIMDHVKRSKVGRYVTRAEWSCTQVISSDGRVTSHRPWALGHPTV